MNIFHYLKEDDILIEKRLNGLLQNYSKWTQGRVFEESKRVLRSIIEHFDHKESLMVNNLKMIDGMQAILAEQKKDKDAIHVEVDNLVMLHVDEDGYLEQLQIIADKIRRHIHFCDKKFYPQMKAHLSKSDLVHINDQLELSAMKSE